MLEVSGDKEEGFYDLFDKIGTHVIKEIKFGSLFGKRLELDPNEI